MDYSGFWRRFWAGLIDAIVLGLITVVVDLFLVTSHYEISAFAKFIIGLLYFGLMESSNRQATLGMMALGIKIVDMDGNKISFLRACGREIATILSALILGVGYLMIAFTKKKQALHDMIAETLVIRS
ncbi:MAG: RDD family protein [Verrucomicrobia bacterium]|nr:RDD family protein [Verrucomicrobiota bacterium]